MKLVDFARWADKGLPTPLSLTLRYAAPEVSLSHAAVLQLHPEPTMPGVVIAPYH